MAAYRGPAKALLVKVIEEMNKVLGFEDPIPVNGTNAKLLRNLLGDIGTIEESDKEDFAGDTWDVLVELAQTVNPVPDWALSSDPDPGEDEEEVSEEEDEPGLPEGEEEEGEGDKEEVQKLVSKVEKSKKLDVVKQLAKDHKIRIPPLFLKDLKKLKTYVIGKLTGEAPAKKENPKEKETPKGKNTSQKSKKATITRAESVFQSIRKVCKKGGTLKDIITVSDEIYVQKGGSPAKSLNHINNVPINMVNALVHFDVLENVDNVYKLI